MNIQPLKLLYTHKYTSSCLPEIKGVKSREKDTVGKERWIEVLKKMMHHHTFTLFPVS